ncbi:hypothetical protein CCP3SC1AL1_1250002 [Gammaproteobacteria bacterium]
MVDEYPVRLLIVMNDSVQSTYVKHFSSILFLVISISLACIVYSASSATELTDQLWVGMKMFPTMVSGDTKLEKKLGLDGKLLLLIVYRDSATLAESVVERLSHIADKISTYPIRIESTDTLDFKEWESIPVAGLFIIESLPDSQFRQAIQFGIVHHTVTFSSFTDHVRDGVLAGIHISGKIRPALNLRTLLKSEIQYNTFILNVSKTYD